MTAFRFNDQLVEGVLGADAPLLNEVERRIESWTDNPDVIGVATFADGSVAAPSIAFTSDPNKNDGIYHTNTFGVIGFTSGGVSRFAVTAFGAQMQSGQFTLQAGSVTAPAICITGDTNTGLYSGTADHLEVTCGGSRVTQFSTLGINFQNLSLISSYASASNIDHIWHDDANDNWNFCSDTTNQATGNSNVVSGRVRVDSGTAAAPSWSFHTDTDLGVYRYAANSLGFSLGNTTRVIMNASGLGIGASPLERFRATDSADNVTVGRFIHTGENTTTTKYLLVFDAGANNGNSPGTNDYFMVFRKGNGTWVGSVNGTGSSGVNYNTTSDERLKTSLERNPDVGAIVDALDVHKFSWDETGQVEYGVFAQQAKPVYSPPITEGDEEIGEEFQPWTADYSKYVGLLLAEVKQLRRRVAALEAV